MQTLPSPAAIAAIALRLNVAFAAAGAIRESDGPNRSPMIDKIESLWGLRGASYCAMGFWYVRFKALAYALKLPSVELRELARMKTLHEQQIGPCSPSCSAIVADYSARNKWRKYDGNDAAFVASLTPGDAVLFDWGAGKHHIGMFVEMEGREHLVTVEWNTGPGAGGSQDDGDGCYRRVRPLDASVWGRVTF